MKRWFRWDKIGEKYRKDISWILQVRMGIVEEKKGKGIQIEHLIYLVDLMVPIDATAWLAMLAFVVGYIQDVCIPVPSRLC